MKSGVKDTVRNGIFKLLIIFMNSERVVEAVREKVRLLKKSKRRAFSFISQYVSNKYIQYRIYFPIYVFTFMV